MNVMKFFLCIFMVLEVSEKNLNFTSCVMQREIMQNASEEIAHLADLFIRNF